MALCRTRAYVKCVHHLSESSVLNIYSAAGHKLEEDKLGRVFASSLAAVLFIRYSISAFWEAGILHRLSSDQISKLYFKTIGVGKDCIQGFAKSVSSVSGRVSEGSSGRMAGEPLIREDYISLFLILIFAAAGSYRIPIIYGANLTCKGMTIRATEGDDPPGRRLHWHSDDLSANRDLVIQRKTLEGSPNLSPIKKIRAGLYEKGDYNQ